jgi:cytochrome c553
MNPDNNTPLSAKAFIISVVVFWIVAGLCLDVITLKAVKAYANESDYRNPVHEKMDKVDLINKSRFNVWNEQCSECHGSDGTATEHGLTVGTPENLFVSVGSKSVAAIVDIVTNGQKKMPAFKDKLNKEEISLISRYVRISYLLWVLEEDTQKLDNIMNDMHFLKKENRRERKNIDIQL